MAGRFSRSFQLVKESFAVLKKDKEIMLFPIISSIVFILLFISFLIPLFFLLKGMQAGDVTDIPEYYAYPVLFLIYLVSYFIVIFFNTGLITCAHIRLNGGDPTFGDGFRNAVKHIGEIFVWSLVASTVGIILRIASDKSNTLGKIVISIIGMAWNLLTFFIVPVLIFEDLSIMESIKKSGYLFKKTWGETVIGKFSMGLFFTILVFFGFIPLVISFFLGSIIAVVFGFAIMLLYWIFLGIVSSSLNGIFITALYNYANTGKIPSAYSSEIIKNAFKPKISRGII